MEKYYLVQTIGRMASGFKTNFSINSNPTEHT